jgi:hypothetical protein
MEHVYRALESNQWALDRPLQLVIDRNHYTYSVTARSLTSWGGDRISWHGSPLETLITDLTKTQVINFVNKELEHDQVLGFRMYGHYPPSRDGLKVSDFVKPHLSNRVIDRLAKDFAKAGGL